MLRAIKILFATVLTSLFLQTANAKAIEGEPAPSFEAKLINGQKFNIESAKGHVVILHFWATWCSTCLEEMPALNEFYEKHKDQGLKIIAISMNDPNEDQDVIKYLDKLKFDAAFNRNSSFKGYGRVWHLPLTFIIDKKGIIRRNGQSDATVLNEKLLEKTVTPLLEKD
jgi:peroxiredoxin